MHSKNIKTEIATIKWLLIVAIFLMLNVIYSCGNRNTQNKDQQSPQIPSNLVLNNNADEELQAACALLISPKNPAPGQIFRVLSVGGKSILKAAIVIGGKTEPIKSKKSRNEDGSPYWRIDEFEVGQEGEYQVTLKTDEKTLSSLSFSVSAKPAMQYSGVAWKTTQGWGGETEALYSAWINLLFYDFDERSSWSALHEVTQVKEQNFLYNYLSLNEDEPTGKIKTIMEPDCADNPFYLRAYFAWKLGLPFGYHECDRGYLGRAPQTGRWITNESPTSKTHPVLSFNAFLRRVMDGVHSGTARTELNSENSDYYPVSLNREALRPGVVFADPYGHTLILVRWISQTHDSPGLLLSVDAQPDKTVGIKRFWKGNFLFTTTEVVGDPGFKAFRPITFTNGRPCLLKNEEITSKYGYNSFSLQQQGITGELFYHKMEQIINPTPLDPETALLDLIKGLHEQLIVRVTSIANGEAYMKGHPGEVIPMPGRPAGVFQAGGQWENFSTPNRDLRLLIAMDAVLDFPDKIVRSPNDFKISKLTSPEKVKENLESFLSQKLSELSITYIRSNGTEQTLSMGDILKRKEAFEMAYNPNDGIEIRWGAPENSEERSTCFRHVPANQLEKMRSVRLWFQKRLHPPT